MIVTYAPDEGDKRRWEYRAEDLLAAEAEAIEDAAGLTFDQWQQRLLEGGMKARRALLWVLLRRQEPQLKFADVSFRVGQLEVDFDADERQKLRAEIERSDDLTEEERAQALRYLVDTDAEELLDGIGDPKDSGTRDQSEPDG